MEETSLCVLIQRKGRVVGRRGHRVGTEEGGTPLSLPSQCSPPGPKPTFLHQEDPKVSQSL